MGKKLVLENGKGKVLRVFDTHNANEAQLIYRHDKRRLELTSNLQDLDKAKVKYSKLSKINFAELKSKSFEIPELGILKYTSDFSDVAENIDIKVESERDWWRSLAGVAVIVLLFIAIILSVPRETPSLEEELKQHVVKIIKRAPKVQQQDVAVSQVSKKQVKKNKKVKKTVSRLGALAVLGRLNKRSKKFGGVNLGAVKTSAGPGLGGGNQGSGGVQTSLYAKGLVAAPVGPGANVRGAGGYGTKGKGGGRDGFGKMSLIGSTGTASIPLGKEAIIQGGLDQDLISAVIQRNMGQIRFCYEQGLQGDPKLNGRIAVDFTIGGNGRVNTAGLKSSTLHSKIVEDCILMRLKTWKFPLPQGGVSVKVSYPFLLRRLGSG